MNMADRAYALIKIVGLFRRPRPTSTSPRRPAPTPSWCSRRATARDLAQLDDPRPLQLRRLPRLLLQAARRGRRQAGERALGDGRRRQAERRRGPVRPARPELLDRYSRDFIDSWEKALDNLKLRSMSRGQARLPGAGGAVVGRDLAARQLLESDQGRDRADAGARGAGRRRGGRAAATAAEAAARRSRKQLPDPTGGLARIGINLALEEVAGARRRGQQRRLGERAPIPAPTSRPISSPITTGSTASRAAGRSTCCCTISTRSAKACWSTANYPSQSGPANEKLRLQVVNLRGTVSRLPKPFARMIVRDRRRVRRRGGRQLQGADERRARRHHQVLPAGGRRQISVRARLRRQRADRRVRAAVRPERHARQVLRRLSRADHRHERTDWAWQRRHAARQGAVASIRCGSSSARPKSATPSSRTAGRRPTSS